METNTFRAPMACSFFAYWMISSSVSNCTSNISPSSILFGLIKKGWNDNIFNNRSFSASTTISTLAVMASKILWYESAAIVLGMFPDKMIISPSCSWDTFVNKPSKSWCVTWGPIPLISVSSSDFIFTLIRVIPFSTCTKSVWTPIFCKPFFSSWPVKPATNPRAVEV